MTTKQVLFRVDDSKLIAFDKKLSDKGISKQFFLNKCVELFLEGKLSFDNNVIANNNEVIASDNELTEIKKQLAIIFERLSKLENDSKVIAFDRTIADTELDNNDSNMIASDNLSFPIQSDIETDIIPDTLPDISTQSELSAMTESIITPESPILPLKEDLGDKLPELETEGKKGDVVSREQILRLLEKHNLLDLGEVKNLASLHPFFTEVNEYQGKSAIIKNDNLSKVASRANKHFLMPDAVWAFLSVEKYGNRWIWTRI